MKNGWEIAAACLFYLCRKALMLDVAASQLDREQTTARLRRLAAARREPRARKKKR